MDYSSLPITIKKADSVQIAREKLVKVYNDISLQYFLTNGQKVKLSSLFVEIRTHRAIIEDKADPAKYFEVHFDRVIQEPQAIQRGFFSKETYKVQLTYDPFFNFELKDANRGNFEEFYSVFRQAFFDSKNYVS